MDSNLRKSYSEVYEILNLMEKEYTDKIPNKIKDLIINEKDNEFKVNISPEVPLENQNLQKDTLTILAILYLNYWYKNEQEKQELIKIFDSVDKKNSEIYSVDNLFKKQEKVISIKEENEETQLIEYKEKFFTKLINKLKRLFKVLNKSI